jgi:hypothetical protein
VTALKGGTPCGASEISVFFTRSCRIMDHVGSVQRTIVKSGFHPLSIRHNPSDDEKASGALPGLNWAVLGFASGQ